ncbi:MAG: hypothetical protein NVV57_09460 [Demequina sp.]|nr:hypothetical protein [Demequina sp.]
MVTIVTVATGATETVKGAGTATFAPTGHAFAYYSLNSKGVPELRVRSIGGSDSRVAKVGGVTWSTWAEDGIQWAPDGSRIAFVSYDSMDMNAIWHTVSPNGSGLVTQSKAMVGVEAAWSPDSSKVAVRDADKNRLQVFAAQGGELAAVQSVGVLCGWADADTVLGTQYNRAFAHAVSTGTEWWGDYVGRLGVWAERPDGRAAYVTTAELEDQRTVTFASK